MIAIIVGIIVIVCIAVAVAIIALGRNSEKKLAEQLELAEAYVAMDEYEDAIKVLEDGYEATGSEEIRKRLEEIEELLQEMEDHVMDWQDANLEAAIRKITGI